MYVKKKCAFCYSVAKNSTHVSLAKLVESAIQVLFYPYCFLINLYYQLIERRILKCLLKCLVMISDLFSSLHSSVGLCFVYFEAFSLVVYV